MTSLAALSPRFSRSIRRLRSRALPCLAAAALLASPSLAEPAAERAFSVRVIAPQGASEGSGAAARGERRRAVLMIPGLGSPGSVWDEAARALVEEGYEAHLFTLAGFAGEPPVEGEFLPRVRRELAAYARQLATSGGERAERPALVGHSLGATLSLWLGASEPELFGPIVAVDGVAFLPALQNPGATVESSREAADGMRGMLEGMTPEAYDRQTAFTLGTMISDPAVAKRIAEASKGSDPSTVARAVHDLMTRDLRPLLEQVRSPVLMLAAGAAATTEEATEELIGRYRQQVAKAPNARVEMIAGTRHFVMLDAPERFLELTLEHLEAGAGEGR
ncbi:MAG: alpha/beta hydrolase [Acidobacteriota bacterium]